MCVFGQHFFVNTYVIEQYRHFLSTYFSFYPFKLPYRCYNIWLELVYKPAMFNWFPCTKVISLLKHALLLIIAQDQGESTWEPKNVNNV